MPGQSGGDGSRASFEKAKLAKFLASIAKQGSGLTDERFRQRSAVARNENNALTRRKVAPYLSPYDQFALNRKDKYENIVYDRPYKSGDKKRPKWSMPYPGPFIDPNNKEQRGEGH